MIRIVHTSPSTCTGTGGRGPPRSSFRSRTRRCPPCRSRRATRMETRMKVDTMLSLLPAMHRDTLVEVYFADRTAKSAASMLGVPVGTVKSRVRPGSVPSTSVTDCRRRAPPRPAGRNSSTVASTIAERLCRDATGGPVSDRHVRPGVDTSRSPSARSMRSRARESPRTVRMVAASRRQRRARP